MSAEFIQSHPGLVCLCGRTIEENLESFVVNQVLSNEAWHAYPAHKLYESVSQYNAFGSMLKTLENLKADPAISLLRRYFLGYLNDARVNDSGEDSADILTSEGVLVKNHSDPQCYRMSSPLVDVLRTKLLHILYPIRPPGPLPLRDNGSLDVVATLEKAVGLFDRQHMADARWTSFKSSGNITVNNMKKRQVPRESVYNTELMRILSNWFIPFDWKVTSQWHMDNESNKHKFSDITLTYEGVTGRTTFVLALLATGTDKDIDSHINKMPVYAKHQSATEAWMIHFTCEDDFAPVEPSLDEGINVLHFVHDLDWAKVVVHGYWKDHNGCTQTVKNKVVVGNAATG